MSLFPLNASILLEARKKNVNKNIKINPEESDYETMVDEDDTEGKTNTDIDEEDSTSNQDSSDENEDYTSYVEDEDTTSTNDDSDNEEDNDETSMDYTEMNDDDDSMSDNIDSDENNEEQDDTSDDVSSDNSSESDESEIEKDIVNTDTEKNKLLMTDFLNLYYFTKNILEKLSSIDKGDIMSNSIISQVKKNITVLRGKLYDYIVNNFSNKYIHNLYQYNFFIQGLNINIEMLKKIKYFNPN